MKKTQFILLFFFFVIYNVSGQSIFELEPTQSMSITGKGPGQDAAINPFSGKNSIGVIKNIGKHNFTIRIQKKLEVIEMITIRPGEIKEVSLLKEYQLYFDSKKKSKAKVTFKKAPDKENNN